MKSWRKIFVLKNYNFITDTHPPYFHILAITIVLIIGEKSAWVSYSLVEDHFPCYMVLWVFYIELHIVDSDEQFTDWSNMISFATFFHPFRWLLLVFLCWKIQGNIVFSLIFYFNILNTFSTNFPKYKYCK